MKKTKLIALIVTITIISLTNYEEKIANASAIEAVTMKNNISIGDSINVYFFITGLTSEPGDSLSAFDLDILYDSNILSFLNVNFYDNSLGVNQLDLQENGSFGFNGDAYIKNIGDIDVYGISGNTDNFLDENQLSSFCFITITFKAISESSFTNISIDLNDTSMLILNSYYDDLPVDLSKSQITLSVSDTNDTNPIPEPGTFLMFTTGLLALSQYRTKK